MSLGLTDYTAAIELAARIAHETNRAYCASIGDHSQVNWYDAPAWQKESAREGVRGILEGRISGPGDSHRSWLEHKQAEGWEFGPLKDPEAKEHPCMVPFEELPAEQQQKDVLFVFTVRGVLACLVGDNATKA